MATVCVRGLNYSEDKFRSAFLTDNARVDACILESCVCVCRLFERYPEAKALFSRVHVDDMNSPEFRAHLLRIMSGIDLMINLFEDPIVLFKEIDHLADQHVAREGMKAQYMTVSASAVNSVKAVAHGEIKVK